jgi:UDP-N-acetylglucosamine--N-acetylmuramyl-(pentapeptide) pyrophosphoryl-undecaprenol N-acetylglucosamine transferase
VDRYRFLISGGGTGGHIYPALAIADELRRRNPDAKFLFVGAKDRMEMEKVPQAGYEIRGLWITGIARKLTWKNLLFPIKLLSSILKSYRILREFKPTLVIGTGGFASGPVLSMAAMLGYPYVLQEQNSFAGVTNKLLSRRAERIFVAYEHMDQFFPKPSLLLSGNPVREALVSELPDKEKSKEALRLLPNVPVLLILGGSLGARTINKLMAIKAKSIQKLGYQLLWQCGKGYYEGYKHLESEYVTILPFITDMAQAYAAADLIVSRAGAGSVSELSLVGKPVLFIPSPNVAEDHQTKNAQAMVAKGAALMLRESELPSQFDSVFSELIAEPQRMQAMGARFLAESKPMATRKIVDEIEKLIHVNHAT